MEDHRLRSVVESLLLVSERPITVGEIEDAAGGAGRAEIEAVLAGIAAAHESPESGIRLREVAGGWQLHTPPDNAEFVKNLLKMKPQRLSAAAMEVLAVIAYRQPATRPEIEEIRGVDCGGPLRVLLDRRLVRILGKRSEVGRPFIYGTTKEFLEFFHLSDLSQLPTLKDFEQLSRELGEQLGGESGGAAAEAPAEAPSDTAVCAPDGPAVPAGGEGAEGEALEGSDELLDELTSAMTRLDSTRKNVVKELGLRPAEPEAEGAVPGGEQSPEAPDETREAAESGETAEPDPKPE
ncbi:MAG: SMC-Scp complex subunit ScpB [Deltaproteobacteria bacterium]|nr:SMC-Scp complex subunit ScpB [Deltaproteobacteria bacterium]